MTDHEYQPGETTHPDRGAKWADHELRAMTVADLRKIAVDARYRWELTKAELVAFILERAPDKRVDLTEQPHPGSVEH